MFSNEIIVKGSNVSGKIKKITNTKNSEEKPYLLYSGLNLGSNNGTTWSSEKLREVADELYRVAAEIDKQNGVKYPPIIKWDRGAIEV